MKNNMYNGTIQAIVKGSMASLVIACLFSISSCKKDAASVAEGKVVELGTGPQLVDSFQFIPTHRTKVNFKVKDAKGNVMTLEAYKQSLKKGGQPLDCGSGIGVDMIELYSLGFTFDNKCFGGTPNSFSMLMTYELTVPADMEPIQTDPASKAGISVAPYGWQSTPSGMGSRNIGFNSMTLISSSTQMGVLMKTWRLTTTGTPINMNDYCINSMIYSNFQVATTCSNFTIVSNNDITGGPIPDDFNITQLQVPDVTLNGSMNGSIHQMAVYWQVPVCQLPSCSNKGFYEWSQTLKFQYRKAPSLLWITPPPPMSPRYNLNSFTIQGLGQGTYTFRYAAELNGTWSDWQSKTVEVQ
jgi:hypothetical protein